MYGKMQAFGLTESFVWTWVASVGSQFWEASFTFRGQKLLRAVAFLIDMAGDIFTSQDMDHI